MNGSWREGARNAHATRALATGRSNARRYEGLVDLVQQGHVDMAEFEHQQAPAALQHAERLAERQLDARHVADAEGDRIGVEMVVGQAQFLGIALHEGDAVVVPHR